MRAKQLLRQKVWWPCLDVGLCFSILSCMPTLPVHHATNCTPTTSSFDNTFQTMAVTAVHSYWPLCPFPSVESLLVCVDAYLRWPEVEIIRATWSEVIIRPLQKIFATHGLPEQVTSINGSNLVSREIEDFFSSHGIYHPKSLPIVPRLMPP
jgi:hypothetical protein